MPTILCFGDSNTWGSDPEGGERLGPKLRWPGVLRSELGGDAWVVEEGLPGRTAAVVDPAWPHLAALPYLLPALESHAPLDAVVLMLGTNDVQDRYARSASAIAMDVLALVEVVERTPCASAQGPPHIVVVAPPPIGDLPDPLSAAEYGAGASKSRELPALLEAAVGQIPYLCGFLDAGSVAAFGRDGIHLGTAGHAALGRAVAAALRPALAQRG